MCESPKSPKNPNEINNQLANDLVVFRDDFAEFNDYCAFFCDAFASIISADEEICDDATIEGIHRYSRWIKRRLRTLRGTLKGIQQKSFTEECTNCESSGSSEETQCLLAAWNALPNDALKERIVATMETCSRA